MPELVGEFLSTYKGNMNVELVIGDSESIYRSVVKGSLTSRLWDTFPERKPLDFVRFYEDRIWAVGSPELEERVYSLEELRSLPLIIREEGSGTRSRVEEALRRHGISLKDMNVVATLGSNEAIRALLKYVKSLFFSIGLGCAG
ncbi:MAG: LysR substrate-binding domain-containing protein [Aquificota bacterium]|nr:LysR substrate-binding domain-containing protein [Aquificota bacterium]